MTDEFDERFPVDRTSQSALGVSNSTGGKNGSFQMP